jgi:phage shock protein E
MREAIRWMERKWVLTVVVFGTILASFGLLTACGGEPMGGKHAPSLGVPVQVGSGAYTNLTPAELMVLLENKDFLLVNTHAPYGYEIAQTDAHIPVDEDGHWLSQYPADRSAMIVLYCRSGRARARASSLAARRLVMAGYENVWHLAGGMVAWSAAGLPLRAK